MKYRALWTAGILVGLGACDDGARDAVTGGGGNAGASTAGSAANGGNGQTTGSGGAQNEGGRSGANAAGTSGNSSGGDGGASGSAEGGAGNDGGASGSAEGGAGNDGGASGSAEGGAGNDGGASGSAEGGAGNDGGASGSAEGGAGNDGGASGSSTGGSGNGGGGSGGDGGTSGSSTGGSGNGGGGSGNGGGGSGNGGGGSGGDGGTSGSSTGGSGGTSGNGGEGGASSPGGSSSGGTSNGGTGGSSNGGTGGSSNGGTGGSSNGGTSGSGGIGGTSSEEPSLQSRLDAGNLHTCLILESGAPRCFGYNGNGQLGDGTTTQRTSPVSVSNLPTAFAVSGGGFVSCAVPSQESTVCWGLNAKSQLGNGTTTNSSVPATVTGLDSVVELAVGGTHVCARKDDDTVHCWGDNTSFKLGTGSQADPKVPAPVTGVLATSIAVGQNHSCAVLVTGELDCWGNYDFFQLSYPPGVTGAVSVTAGYTHSCALLEDGSVTCFGDGAAGQLGDGDFHVPAGPVLVSGLTGVQALSAGHSHTCALLENGHISCWGSNGYGQLGDGTTLTRTTPVEVSGITTAVAITAGYAHSCALLDDQSVRCWGWNSFGQLGLGSTASRTTPATIPGVGNPVGGAGGLGSGGSGAGGNAGVGNGGASSGGNGGTGGEVGTEALPAPRLVAPLSANMQGPRPELFWITPPEADVTRVELCRDRDCLDVVGSWTGVSGVEIDRDLTPGAYFWRGFSRRQLEDETWVEGTLASATWEFFVDHSTSPKLLGFGNVPDHDGDGRADLAIMNSSETGGGDFQNGSASLYELASNGTSLTRRQKLYSDGIVNGSVSGAQFATAWRNAGDVNGDGYPDVVTVSDFNVLTPRIRLYRGGPGGLTGSSANDVVIGTSTFESIWGLEAPGDVDGDGYADVIVLFDKWLGAAYQPQFLFVRGSGAGLLAPVATDMPYASGPTWRALGDVNGDGYPDLSRASNDYNSPGVRVYLGGPEGYDPTSPDYDFTDVVRAWPVGDVDGDGLADTVMESFMSFSSSTVPDVGYLVRGGSVLELDPESTVDYPEYAPRTTECRNCTFNLTGTFHAAGDVNGDGYGDVLLYGKTEQLPKSRVYVIYGSADGLGEERRELWSPDDVARGSDGYFGWSIAGFGDLDGDTLDDIAIGATDVGSPGAAGRIAPKVRVFRGTFVGPSVDPAWILQSSQSVNLNDGFGVRMSGLGG